MNNLPKTGVSLTILLFATANIYAQDYRDMARQYEQRKADNARAETRINQQYLNNLPNQRSSAINIATPTETKAEKQAEESRKWSDMYKPTAEELKSQRIMAGRQRLDAANFKIKNQAIALELSQLGFTMNESYTLANLATTAAENNNTEEMAKLPLAKSSIQQFNAKASTGSYDELVTLALGFRAATYTATKAFQQIEARFPDKSAEINLMILKIMPGYFAARNGYLKEQEQTAAQNYLMGDAFIKLLKMYPVETNTMASQCVLDPFQLGSVGGWMYNKEDLDQKATIFLHILQYCKVTTPIARPVNFSYDGYKDQIQMVRGCNNFFGKHPEFIKKLKLSFWEEVAADNHIPVTDIMAHLSFSGNVSMGSLKFYHKKIDEDGYHLVSGNYYNYNIPDMVAELAKKGNADAMNAYAIAKFTKGGKSAHREAIALLKNAAAKGHYMATLNLYDATTWNIDGYDDSDGKIANSTYAYIEKGTAEDAYAAAYFFSDGGLWQRAAEKSTPKLAFAAKLLKLAADKGNEDAQSKVRYYLK
jgi:hypothetical protein